MTKVIMSPDIKVLLAQRKSFFDRTDMQIFTANSNEEALNIHQAEKAHLIIAQQKRLGMSSRQFCSIIREDPELSRVLIILICANIPSEIEESSKCRADAVLTRPVNTADLLEKAHDLLDILQRTTLRVLLKVTVDGTVGTLSFFCRSVNISITGMLFETEQNLVIGDMITCSFFLPATVQINAAAEVVRNIKQSHGFGPALYGVRFTALSPEAMRAVKAFVEKNIPQ